MDDEISGENLAVMGVTAKIKVNAGSSDFFQLFWLMINKNNWLALVQRTCELGWSLPGAFYFFTAGGVPAADDVKFVIDQNGFIV